MEKETFCERIQRGREFEERERSYWIGGEDDDLSFEAPTRWKGKRGRIDIRLANSQERYVVVVELKATEWDKMLPHRVRPNALRHVRQIWRYVETELQSYDAHPAIVYPSIPSTPGRKEEVETILNERGIQAVWRS